MSGSGAFSEGSVPRNMPSYSDSRTYRKHLRPKELRALVAFSFGGSFHDFDFVRRQGVKNIAQGVILAIAAVLQWLA